MKVLMWIAAVLLFAESAPGQQDSLADVFPLKVANSWVYHFSSVDANGMTHTAVTDTGLVQYTITGRIQTPDSTRWMFVRQLSFTRSFSSSPYWYSGYDSSNFEIIELLTGRHELYASIFNRASVFTFTKAAEDSERFFRYVRTDSSGAAHLKLALPNYYQSDLDLRADTGIIRSDARQSSPGSLQFYLVDHLPIGFSTSAHAGPYLGRPDSLRISSFVGIPKDTTISLTNLGIDTLRISSIESSDTSILASLSVSDIPPVRSGVLMVRCLSNSNGTTSASLVLRSNSPSSPDTMTVVVNHTRMGAVMRLGSRTIDFGAIILSRRYRDTVTTVSNDGNVPLTLDSLRITSPEFSISLRKTTLAPGETALCDLRCTPTPIVYHDAYLILYTNAVTSPDSLHVQAMAQGAVLSYENTFIDFGRIPIGTPAETVIVIRPVGNASLLVSRSVANDPSYILSESLPGVMHVFEVYKDTVRFKPTALGERNSLVFYSHRSTYSGDDLTVTDTIRLAGTGVASGDIDPSEYTLKQNYPNPFNPGTRIDYELPASADVDLTVFNLLGQPVATLVHERQDQGFHRVDFNAAQFPGGIYFYRLRSGGHMMTGKMVLIR